MKVRYSSLLAALCLSCLSQSALASDEFTIVGTQNVSTVSGSMPVEFRWKFRYYGGDGVELMDVTPKLANEQTLPGYVVDETGIYPVRRIGNSALANSPALTSVKLSAQTTEIGDLVFANCPILSSVELNSGLRSIGRAPFLNTIVTTIDLPNTVINMSGNVAAGALFTTKVNIGDSSHFVTSDDGCIYNKDKTRLYSCPGRASGTVTLPASLTEIMADAFFGCFDLTYLNVPANVQTIGSKAFNVNGIWSNLSASESSPKLETVFYQGEKPITNAAEDIYEGAPDTLTSYAFTSSWTEGMWKKRPLKVTQGASSPILKSTVNGIEWSFRIVDNAYAEIYNNGKAAIAANHATGAITVPTSLFGYPVSRIGDYAFVNCNKITKLALLSTVSEIGNHAFAGCTALISINSTTGVGNVAWQITLPEGIENVGYRAFDGDSKFQKLVIPATLTSISNNPIAGCKFLSEIQVADSNMRFAFDTPLLFDISKTRLIACLPTATVVTVPDTVKTLGAESFDGCVLLESLVFPGDAPEDAPADLFAGLSPKLTVYANASEKASWAAALGVEPWKSLVEAGRFVDTGAGAMTPTVEDEAGNSWTYLITDGVAEIVSLKPAVGTALLSVTLPTSVGRYVVKSIGDGALANLRGITSVTIPATYETIGDYAFSNCTSLADVTINSGVISLGKAPFYGTKITSLSLPNSLTALDGNPIAGCPLVTSVTADNTAFKAADGLLYNAAQTALLACVPNKTEVTVPASVTKVADDAFAGCANLKTVTFLGNEPAAGDHVLDDAPAAVVKADACQFNWGTPVPKSWKGHRFVNVGKAPPAGIQTAVDSKGVSWTYTVTADGEAVIGASDVAVATMTEGEVELPSDLDGWPLVKVAAAAFRDCPLITKITISGPVTEIDESAFLGCKELQSFAIDATNTAYAVRNGVLYSKDGSTLVKVPAGFRFDTTVTCVTSGTAQKIIEVVNGFDKNLQFIPNTVISEGSTSVPKSTTTSTFTPEISGKTLLNGVTAVADGAFADCGYLPVGTTARGTLTVVTDGKTVSTQSGQVTLSVGTDSTNTTATTTTTTKSGFYNSQIAAWKTVRTICGKYSFSVSRPNLSGIRHNGTKVWKNTVWEGTAAEEDEPATPVVTSTSQGDAASARLPGDGLQVVETGLGATVVRNSLTIQSLETPSWLNGEFNGPVFADESSSEANGYATATITKSGKVTGKIMMPSSDGTKAMAYFIPQASFSAYDDTERRYTGTAFVMIGKTKKEVAISCRLSDDGTQTGVLVLDLGSDGVAELCQNIWKRSDLTPPATPVGRTVVVDGFTFKFQAKGKVTWTGTLTGDNGASVRASGTTQLFNDGKTTFIYAAPKRNLVGGRAGLVELQ